MSKHLKSIENLQRGELIAHKKILSFREALVPTDLSSSLLYKLTSRKAIKFTKPNGGKIYFKKADLDEWMLQNESISKSELEERMSNYLKGKGNEKS